MRDYKKIIAYQLADELAIAVYSTTKHFPKDELYGITSQMRRAAVSIPANIVEGARRASKKEYLQFLHIAQASLSEVEYYIHLAHELKYIDDNEYNKTNDLCSRTFSKLYGLIESVRKEI